MEVTELVERKERVMTGAAEAVTLPNAKSADRAHEATADGRVDYTVEVDVRGTIHVTVSR